MSKPVKSPPTSSLPKEYSPFTPGQPVSIESFVGRRREIELLTRKAGQAADTRRLQVAFLTGERGIGKTSLAAFVRVLAHRDHQVLGLHLHLGGADSLEEVVRRMFDELLKQSVEKPWFQKAKDFLGSHVQQVGLFGVSLEFRPPARDLQYAVRNFGPSLRRLSEALKSEARGILVILDDINGLAQRDDFANWLKSTVDEIATSGQGLPLCILAVGLEERRQALISHQESLARVFDLVEIKAWAEEETEEFFKQSFSKVGITVQDGAMQVLCDYAGGLPMLAHEIGDAAFNASDGSIIDLDDAFLAVAVAADIIGRKYLEPKVLTAIGSAEYRGILRKLVLTGPDNPLGFTFKRRDLLDRVAAKERGAVDNFLRRMRDLGVLHSDPEGGRGSYRFDNQLHYIYFSFEAQRHRDTRT